jgi:hypothetical protein
MCDRLRHRFVARNSGSMLVLVVLSVVIALDLINTRSLMDKEVDDQRKIDSAFRCAGSDPRGLCKHRAEGLSYRSALSMEEKHCDNGLLDRGAAQPQQPSAESRKLMGQRLEQKLRRI